MSAGLSGPPPADYTSYVLALEWQPQWSLRACPGSASADPRLIEAMAGSLGAWARQNLSLHGLWPEYTNASAHAGWRWPQWCNASRLDYRVCEREEGLDGCQPTEQALADYNVSGRWQSWAIEYAFGSLAAHEWSKHGSCSPSAEQQPAQLEYWSWQEEAVRVAAAGHGSRLVSASAGGAVRRADLLAAFERDTGGRAVALRCEDACRLSQVWLGFRAEPATLRPLLDPDHAVAVSGGSCGQCVAVAIAAWSGCPRRATFDRALAIAAGALLGLGLLVCALPPLRQRAAHLARTLRPAAPLGRSLAMSPAPLAGEKRVVMLSLASAWYRRVGLASSRAASVSRRTRCRSPYTPRASWSGLGRGQPQSAWSRRGYEAAGGAASASATASDGAAASPGAAEGAAATAVEDSSSVMSASIMIHTRARSQKNSQNTSLSHSTLAQHGRGLARTGTHTGSPPEPPKRLR